MVSETERRKAAEDWLDKFMGTFSHPTVGPAIRLLCTENNGAWLIDATGAKWRLSEVLADFAKEREDSALLEAAGLVCKVCRDKEIHGLPVTKLERNNSGQWWHRTGRQDISLPCHAWPIHERRALKGNG